MYLLYLDGSGSVKNPGEQHFVLGAGMSTVTHATSTLWWDDLMRKGE